MHEGSDQWQMSWRPIQPRRAASRMIVLRHRRDQRHANLLGNRDVSRRWQSGEREHPTAVMTAAGSALAGILVVTMIVVEVRHQ